VIEGLREFRVFPAVDLPLTHLMTFIIKSNYEDNVLALKMSRLNRFMPKS